MKYGTINEQQRNAMKKGDTFVCLFFHDNYETGAELIGRFHNEEEALKARHAYVNNELGGLGWEDFELRFYAVDERESEKFAGRKLATCYENYYI